MSDNNMRLMRQNLIQELDKIIAPVTKTYGGRSSGDFYDITSDIPDDDFITIAKYLHDWLLECPREEREEAYNLIFSTIGQKLRLDNLKHLTQKIKWVKSSIDNPDIFISILESDLDVYQYANWNIEQLDLPENALNKSESQQTLWAIDDMPNWRKQSYKSEQGRYESLLTANAAPSQTLVQNIIREIADRANKRYSGVLHEIYNTWFTHDLSGLADVLGMFDFIKEINRKAAAAESSIPVTQDLDTMQVSSDNVSINFSAYLNEKGKPLLPYLIDKYKGAKIQEIAMMLFALQRLGLLFKDQLISFGQDELADAVGNIFVPQTRAKKLSRQALNISKYNTNLSHYTDKIDKPVALIEVELKRLNTDANILRKPSKGKK